MTMKRFLAALSLMLVVMGAVACAGGSDSGGEGDTAARSADQLKEPAAMVEEQGELSAGSDAGTTSGGGGSGYTSTTTSLGGRGTNDAPAGRDAGLPDLGLSVIKTATVALEVKDDQLQETIQNATSTAEKYGGFVVTTDVTDDEEHPYGTIVIRIPASRFGDALADLESLGNVEGERVSGEDVTQEFIDLQARLRNYVAQETVMLRLMEQSQTVTDTIRVQNELQRIQLEIERLRGRITYLDDQTSMSTIELRIAEEGAISGAPGEFEKAWERAKDGAVAVIAGLISSLGVVVPVALLTLLVVFIVARLRPRFTNPG